MNPWDNERDLGENPDWEPWMGDTHSRDAASKFLPQSFGMWFHPDEIMEGLDVDAFEEEDDDEDDYFW
jgi:hypothetical protein